MTLLVETGHVLVVGTKEYPIIHAEKWTLGQRISGTFARRATLIVSLKKETFAGGKGSESTYATDIQAMPLDPDDAQIKQTLGLDTPHQLKETYIQDEDEYARLIVEDLK